MNGNLTHTIGDRISGVITARRLHANPKAPTEMFKVILSLFLRLSGVPFLIRELLQRRLVTIIVYHRLDSITAERHFRTLRKLYNPITLRQYVHARQTGTTDKLPSKSLIVTFDDGHESIYRLKTLLETYQIPATVFVCSGMIDTNHRFWFSAPALHDDDRQYLKTVSDEERIARLRAMHFDSSPEFEVRESLDSAEIRELRSVIDFQSHTVSHPILSACSDVKCRQEIAHSKIALEQRFGFDIYALAYPNGDCSEREMDFVREAGYRCALSIRPRFNGARSPMLALNRICMRDEAGIHELVVRTCGLWEFLRRMFVVSQKVVRGGSRPTELASKSLP